PLTAAERASIRETRLRLVQARAGESLAALLTRANGKWSPDMAAVANGLDAATPLQEGLLIKVPVERPYRSKWRQRHVEGDTRDTCPVRGLRRSRGAVLSCPRAQPASRMVRGAPPRVRGRLAGADEAAARRGPGTPRPALPAPSARRAEGLPHLPRRPLLEGQDAVQDAHRRLRRDRRERGRALGGRGTVPAPQRAGGLRRGGPVHDGPPTAGTVSRGRPRRPPGRRAGRDPPQAHGGGIHRRVARHAAAGAEGPRSRPSPRGPPQAEGADRHLPGPVAWAARRPPPRRLARAAHEARRAARGVVGLDRRVTPPRLDAP